MCHSPLTGWHFFHRWTRWQPVVIKTTENTFIDTNKRSCARCGLTQRHAIDS
jgi:hypothetical protein